MVASTTSSGGDILWLAARLASAAGGKGRLTRRDRVRLGEAARTASAPAAAVLGLYRVLGLQAARWRREADEADLPLAVALPDGGFLYAYARNPDGGWRAEGPTGRIVCPSWPEGAAFLAVRAADAVPEADTARALFTRMFGAERAWIVQAAAASLVASILVLGTSIYTMQVYDRVISTGGVPTLVVLTIGVAIAIAVELLLKIARSGIVDHAVHRIDLDLANGIFARLLGIRFDQFPASVGNLAAQVSAFQTVRGFKVAATLYLVTEAPFALFFLWVILLLGGPMVAAVPAVAVVLATGIGFAFKRAIQRHSTRETMVGNRRQGLLVEAIRNIETLKAGGAAWRLSGRWNELSRQTADESMEIKHLNDLAGFFAAAIQQVSYVGLVAAGAYLATTSSSLTIGAIIACSIVSGRVLTPVNMIPGLLVQWAHAKVALDNLEKIFALERDNHGTEAPLVPEAADGAFALDRIEFGYPGQGIALTVPSFRISAGEKVGVLGTVGAGKSTLLRVLAGLAKPERGQALFDGLDLQQVAAERRAELIGYLPQQTWLFSGTLRDNLILGLPHVGDEEILEAAKATGLADMIAGRPQGLDLPIPEGGEGLSGGQKQLVAVTRLLLARPRAWLLDEPTAAMDDMTEQRCQSAFKNAIGPEHTLVLVTHKLSMLGLVDRVVILTPRGIAMDGPKAAVLEQLLRGASAGGGSSPNAPGSGASSQPLRTHVVQVSGGRS